MAIQAVLTADIVNSTRLGSSAEKALLKILRQVLGLHRYEFYRGDSFQAYLKNAGDALRTALLCRAAAIGIVANREGQPSDIRISIGIGKTKPPGALLGAAKGEAFVLSGRAFDKMAAGNARLAITTADAMANEGLQVTAAYLDAIFTAMSSKQAVVIFELLKGETQQAAATKLMKSKSTIHQHATAGNWPAIEDLLLRYNNIINLLA